MSRKAENEEHQTEARRALQTRKNVYTSSYLENYKQELLFLK